MSCTVEAIIHHHELVVVVAIKFLLPTNVVYCHSTQCDPGLQHSLHICMYSTSIIQEEVGFWAKESGMVCNPFSDPLWTQVSKQWGATVDILVNIVCSWSWLVLAWSFRECHNALSFPPESFTIAGIHHKLPPHFVCPHILLEGAIDGDSIVEVAIDVAIIRKHLEGHPLHQSSMCTCRDPLTLIRWIFIEPCRLFCFQANDCKGVWSSSVCWHLYEEVHCHSVSFKSPHIVCAWAAAALDLCNKVMHRNCV